MYLITFPTLLALQFSNRICNHLAQYAPTTGSQISNGTKQLLLNVAVSLGDPSLTNPTDIQRIWHLRPFEYVQTSLIIAARKFYYHANASSQNQAYIESVAQGVRDLAQQKLGNKPLYLDSLQAKTKELLNEKIKDSSFTSTTLATYALTGVAASLLRWGGSYFLLSWTYPNIPFLSTVATIATLYGWAILITPSVRTELLNVEPLSLPDFANVYDEETHEKVAEEAKRIFQLDDVDAFKNSRGEITLPTVAKSKSPFSQLIVPTPTPPIPAPTKQTAPVDPTDPPLVEAEAPQKMSKLQGEWQRLKKTFKSIKKDTSEYLTHYAKMDEKKAKMFSLQRNWGEMLKYETKSHRQKETSARERR